ncbi:amidohydrolase family protein [Arenimonas terrae]|uniref:Amidohydrolase n=1 Tax=Arenimonas terrae TaxID=2546226 RepID=A0A5C4RW99_9GAMM|nr:amidohydrolase family protein [Arenimonas terrae]TNJ35298.1 amidohydrolase [Arenimonas terrae]
MKLLKIGAAASAVALAGLLWTMAPEPAATAPARPDPTRFVIRDVRVFDGETFVERATVRVRNGLIEAVGADVAAPAGWEVVEGGGRTLLPGLIDAHVHTWGEARRDALRFGVTTQLDMFSDHRQLAVAKAERADLSRGDQADLWSAGTLATAEGGHGTQFGLAVPTLATPAEAPAWVAARQAEGSDFIKIVREDLHVYTDARRLPTLDAATSAAVISAAHAAGLRAVVHASAQDAARESLRDGADGLVHVFQDQPADEDVVALAKARGAFVVPTLTVIAGFSGERSALADDPRLAAWLSAGQRETLAGRMHEGAANPVMLANAVESVRRLHAAGVVVLAGTDAPNPNTAHGVSLHEEIARLADAGLGVEAALAAATSAPARAFGLADRGRIAPGLRADLVLVEGDPRQDIRATRAIATIWKNGHRVDRRVEPTATPVLEPGPISHFDGEAIDGRVGSGWVPTSDQMAGGRSQARIDRVAGGADGSAGALRVSGNVQAGGTQVWAGAFYNPGEQMMQALDVGPGRELVLRVRGDGRELSVMLFSGAQGGAPAVRRVPTGPAWREHRLALDGFAGADPSQLRAFAITTDGPAGAFEFDLDQVEIR